MICQHRQNWRICNICLTRRSQTKVKQPDNLEMMHHLLPFWPLYMLWTPVGTVRLIKWSDYKCLNILITSPSPLLFLWPGHWDPLSVSCPVCYICLLSFSFLLSFPLYSHLLSSQSSVWWQQEKMSRGETIGRGHSLVFHSALSLCSSLPQIHFERFFCYLNSLKHFSVFFFVIWGMKCWFPVVNSCKCRTGLKSVPLDCGSDSHPVDNISKRENFSKFILNPRQVCQATLYLVLNTTVCVMLRHTRYQG